MTQWDLRHRRSGRVSIGAAGAILILLVLGLVFYSSSNQNQLASSLRPFSLPNTQGLSTSLMGISSWASIFKDLKSFPPSVVFPAPPTPGVLNATSNWAGYIVTASGGRTATYVNGSWVQPQVNCPSSGASGVLVWVGLGGLSKSPVQQIGTMAYCENGQAAYLAWYESYPINSGIKLLDGMSVAPGKQVSASVSYSEATQQFTYSITVDGDAPHSFSESYPTVGPPHSAEWIVEPPFAPHGFMVMSDFGTATFTKGAATVGGHSNDILGLSQGPDVLVRSAYACSGVTKASPGPLTADSGFTVSWNAGGSC